MARSVGRLFPREAGHLRSNIVRLRRCAVVTGRRWIRRIYFVAFRVSFQK